MSAIGKIELMNFLHACGIENISEALRLKSLNLSDAKILAKYGIKLKAYKRWTQQYSSVVGKSVMMRKRGKLIAMKCIECGNIVRWDEKYDRVCEKCGLIIPQSKQTAERIRYALRELEKPIANIQEKRRIENLLELGYEEQNVIKIMASK